MGKLRCVLVVLAASGLFLSFAVPSEDLPETLYDESEALPYEGTPPFSIIEEESALILKSKLSTQLHSGTKRQMLAELSEGKAHPICDSISVLDRSLRC